MEAIQGEHSVDSVQRTAVLGTSHNTEGTAVRNWKCECWGSPLVQEIWAGFTLSQATKALRESRCIALLYFRLRH